MLRLGRVPRVAPQRRLAEKRLRKLSTNELNIGISQGRASGPCRDENAPQNRVQHAGFGGPQMRFEKR